MFEFMKDVLGIIIGCGILYVCYNAISAFFWLVNKITATIFK